jgi:hypothetical protein
MAKLKLIYSPEAATPREFVVDMGNPPWDIMFATEKATDWPWGVFQERLENQSAIAWRALLWVLRKRDEARLKIEYVELNWEELDIEAECPKCKGWVSDGDHECPVSGDEVAEAGDEVGDVDPEA